MPFLRGEEQERAVLVGAGVDDGLDALVGPEREEVDERGAARGALLHRDLVRAQPVRPAAVREEQQVRVRGGGEQVLDVVLVAQVAAAHAAPTATLAAERVGRDRLDVALAREHDDDLFVVDEVEHVEIADVDGELASGARRRTCSRTSASSSLITVASLVVARRGSTRAP